MIRRRESLAGELQLDARAGRASDLGRPGLVKEEVEHLLKSVFEIGEIQRLAEERIGSKSIRAIYIFHIVGHRENNGAQLPGPWRQPEPARKS